MADQFYMTQEGYEAAKKQLEYLQTVKRAEIVERIAEARSHGDLSENAEYDAARNEQAANEGEIAELDYKVKNAVIIEETDDNSVVHIGSAVTVYDEEMEEEVTYTIMGTTEVDAMRNIVSNESPVGAALLGHKKGERVTVKAPESSYILKIVKIG
ncbi:MAG TPA: transcription elongation factor GreA [Candidatus Gallimonas gallistercoris]|uniref:Transcription elongation factor GreA n=1 Tax=Candidatus Gallimonas gallistercoris TaxID=2838602 RepID=A0A9D2H4I0_9FIRM|nr:transcription elongation factor GreA [Candidatus Gallimonas gallistercoris]